MIASVQTWLMASLLLLATNGWGHTLAPSLLEIQEKPDQNGQYTILWRVDRLTPQMQPAWPEACQASANSITLNGRQLDHRYELSCPPQLNNSQIEIQGLSNAPSAVLLRRMTGQQVQEQLIQPRSPYFQLNPTGPQSHSIVLRYLVLGIEHILLGADHILLVLGLFFLAQGFRQLLSLSLCFTLGHSITLLVAGMQWLSIPSASVELAIAVSLLYTALQLSKPKDQRHPARYQWFIFSLFGLIHGLGFASALQDLELPTENLLIALLSFNLGIESGQLIFLGGLALLLNSLQRLSQSADSFFIALSRYAIGVMACFWCLDRGLLLLN